MKAGLLAIFCLWAVGAQALELDLARSARETIVQNTDPDSYFVPFGAFEGGRVPGLTIEGAVRRSAFRMDVPGLTPLQVLQPLRAQLADAGYDLVLDCADTSCGGFDFRFLLETLPPPEMIVNLRRFHFLTALQGSPDRPDRVVTLLASTSAASAYLQIIQAGDLGDTVDQFTREGDLQGAPPAPQATPVANPAQPPADPEDFRGKLLNTGVAILADVDFATGTSELGAGPFKTIEDLAALMLDDPQMRVAVVGHTDNVGSLEGNTRLSRARARSVRAALINTYGIAGARIEAEGVGHLSPVASNATEDGRARNRRVEVILLEDAGG